MNDEPSVAEMAKLWKVCSKFIEHHQLADSADVYGVLLSEHALDLISTIAEVVGSCEDV